MLVPDYVIKLDAVDPIEPIELAEFKVKLKVRSPHAALFKPAKLSVGKGTA